MSKPSPEYLSKVETCFRNNITIDRANMTTAQRFRTRIVYEAFNFWLNDKDIEEGKMWYYYCYIMCDKLRKEAKTMLMLEDDEDEEHEYR